jgi:cytochrome oxidase Cu insertion factor (SCO1/SenC/PrrC family)
LTSRLKRWINPWSVAFVFGLVFLTALPLLQRRFLKAPAPVGTLGSWTLSDVEAGRPLGNRELADKVVLATFAPQDCGRDCVERHEGLRRALAHTDDLGDKVRLVTFAAPAAAATLRGSAPAPRLHLLTGTPEQLDVLAQGVRRGWDTFAGTDAGSTPGDLLRLPAYMVVDQAGAIRGFWRTDAAGRGNAINAARLLARHGPNP